MELQHFSHEHPLVLVEKQSHESDKAYCSGCGELISGPSFGCAECGFWLHKVCAEAPAEINHPFHREHSLELLVSPAYRYRPYCNFCNKEYHKFVYYCYSCDLGLHIKCALFSKSIAEKSLEDVPQKDALVSLENFPENLNDAKCCACLKWLWNFAYLDLGNGILLHKKCVDLPLEINHFLHTEHSLILQFNALCPRCQICDKSQYSGFVYCCLPCNFTLHVSCAEPPAKINHLCHRNHPLFLVQYHPEFLPCQICQTRDPGFVYCCSTSTCKISVHVDCAFRPPIIRGEIHQHPFTLFWRQASFICDACGTAGNHASYICSKCSLTVHEDCISLPRILRFPRHRHQLSHTFILWQHEIQTRKCEACPEEVNAEHGVYCCFDCNYIVHANCARRGIRWFDFDELEDTDEQLEEKSAFVVIKETQHGEDAAVASVIKHINHPQHNLVLSDDSEGDRFCDGCFSSISTSFYYCSQCDFILHKSCAESPLKKYLWFHTHQRPLTLTLADRVFRCGLCFFEFNSGFAYKCSMCWQGLAYICLACALVSDTPTLQGHEHRLSYYEEKSGQCSGCGDELYCGAFTCKDCNFAVDWKCLRLPNKIVHRCDDHPLMLTFHEDNLYSEYNYCDICEQRRDPKKCFYHCAECSTSTHYECAVKIYSFMKLGGSYKLRNHNHSHTLTFTHSIEACHGHRCHQLCLDLSLECSDKGCDYILHWDCIKSSLRTYAWDWEFSFIRRADAGTS